MLNSLFCKTGGLVKDFRFKTLFLSIEDLGVQFRCQVHPCALMLILGSFVGFLAICFELCLGFLADWEGFFLEGLAPIMGG